MAENLTARRAWAAIGWMGLAAVVLLSVWPVESAPLPGDYGDKLAHFICYAVLAYGFGQLYRNYRRVFIGLVLLGGVLELVQGALPFRSAELLDGLADALGVFTGLWLAHTRAGGLLAWLERQLAHASR